MMPKNKIMFVCTGNTCRSPMAEAVFNRFAEEKGLAVRAESMGTTTVTGMPVSENSVEVCKEIGIDISDMHSTAYSDKKLVASRHTVEFIVFVKFFLMTQCAVPADKIEVINVADPYMCGVEVYRQCRDEICSAVKEILKQYEN